MQMKQADTYTRKLIEKAVTKIEKAQNKKKVKNEK